jgi:hypothetical protein
MSLVSNQTDVNMTVAASGGSAYATINGQRLVRYVLDTPLPDLRWTYAATAGPLTAIGALGTSIYIGDGAALQQLDSTDGAVLSSFVTPAAVRDGPIVGGDGLLYFPTADNCVLGTAVNTDGGLTLMFNRSFPGAGGFYPLAYSRPVALYVTTLTGGLYRVSFCLNAPSTFLAALKITRINDTASSVSWGDAAYNSPAAANIVVTGYRVHVNGVYANSVTGAVNTIVVPNLDRPVPYSVHLGVGLATGPGIISPTFNMQAVKLIHAVGAAGTIMHPKIVYPNFTENMQMIFETLLCKWANVTLGCSGVVLRVGPYIPSRSDRVIVPPTSNPTGQPQVPKRRTDSVGTTIEFVAYTNNTEEALLAVTNLQNSFDSGEFLVCRSYIFFIIKKSSYENCVFPISFL